MSGVAKEKKAKYVKRVIELLAQYPKVLFATCDHIGSRHMQRIRISLRGYGILLMGKNTMIRFAIRSKLEEHPEYEPILEVLKGNVGLIFTNGDLGVIQEILDASKVPASAKAGIAAPNQVNLDPHVTQLDPQKTQFFAALDIATRITRGCVEILGGRVLCKEGEKVGSSEAALLQMLDIKPFEYGMILKHIYDQGSVYSARLAKMTADDLMKVVALGVCEVAALSLAISYPSLPAFPHVVANHFKNLLAVALETNYVFKQAEKVKERVENPDAFAVAAPTSSVSAPVAAVEEEEEEESEEFGDDLFGF